MPIYLIKRSDGYIWALMTTVTSFAFAGRFGHAGTGAERPPIIHPQRDAGAANRRRGRARSPGNRNHHLAFAPWATGSNSGSRVTTELNRPRPQVPLWLLQVCAARTPPHQRDPVAATR